jgi:hypothetical protein
MSSFEKLNKINVNEYTEKKGQFTYLSWAWAVRELLQVAPEATWKIHEWGIDGNRQPYMKTEAGCFVQVTVTIDDIDRTQVHPVLDNRNKTIDSPNAFQINTSIQRCLAKAIALHGLGLYLFAGEDLPVPPGPITSEQYEEITLLMSGIKDFDGSDIIGKIDSGVINETNYKGSLAKLKRMST